MDYLPELLEELERSTIPRRGSDSKADNKNRASSDHSNASALGIGVLGVSGFYSSLCRGTHAGTVPVVYPYDLEIINGYAINPVDNLIKNGDFSAYTTNVSGTEYNYDDWNHTTLIGTPQGYLATLEHPTGSYISSVSEQPIFNTQGLLTNTISPLPEYHLESSQGVNLTVGQEYLLEFTDVLGSPSFTRADGFFFLGITQQNPIRLRARADTITIYQIKFTAQNENTVIQFVNEGVAQATTTTGWDLGGKDYSKGGLWDDVSLVAIPEPGILSTLLIGVVILKLFYAKCKRRRSI